MPAEVKSTLLRTLRTTEYFTLAFGTMVGVGWLIVIDDWLVRGGPGGAMLGFLLGGIALLPVAYVYGIFVRELPVAGSEMAYAGSAFSSPVSFLSGWLMTLAYLIVCPWEAVAIGKLAAYLVPQIQSFEIYRIGKFPVYLPSLLLGLGLTILIIFLNYRGIKLSSRFQNYTTFAVLFLFALFNFAGIGKMEISNMQPFFSQPDSGMISGALISVIMVLQIVPYFVTGFESVPKASEEASEDFSPRNFSKAIYLGLCAGVLFYVCIIGVVSGLVPWRTLIGERYATVSAFSKAFGSPLLVNVILFAAFFSLLKVFNANFLAASRLIFALGRQNFLSPALSSIHPKFRSPNKAVLFCGVVTICGAFLGDAILIPVTEVGSLCSAFGWAITCAAFLKIQTKQLRRRVIASAGVLVACVMLALKLIPAVPGSFGVWEYVALAGWLTIGLLMKRSGSVEALSR